MEQEKQLIEKKRQIRRSNERLKMIEEMEKQKQIRIEQEIEKLNEEKQRRDDLQMKKREMQKQRRYVQVSAGRIE
jgi:hypothetical protein